MPKFVTHENHLLLVGPGLDDVLEPNKNLILIDDYFSDVYSDYIFAGYDTFVSVVEPTKPDVIGAFDTATLISKGSSIIVCGFKPDFCLLTYPAYLTLYKGLDYTQSIKETESLLSELYQKDVKAPYQTVQAIRVLDELRKSLGLQSLSSLFLVAANYDYGKNKFRYADRLVWLNEIGAEREYLYSALLYFLIEGHGSVKDLFKFRLETLGKENLVKIVGEKPLEILNEIVNDNKPKILKFVDSLDPGGVGIQYIKRTDGTLEIQCLVTPSCLAVTEKAKKLLPLETERGEIREIKVIPSSITEEIEFRTGEEL